MDILLNFSERLSELMIYKNINAATLARESNCPKSSVSAWLSKQVYPKLENLIRLSEYFDCSIDYLLGLTDSIESKRSEVPTTFAKRITQIMKDRNITKYKLAKDCNFHSSRFTHWILKGNHPQTENLIIIAEYLNCSLEYILGLSDFF